MNNQYDFMLGDLLVNINNPMSKINPQSITALVKHGEEIIGYQLSNGEEITKERGLELAKQGVIYGVSVSISKNGEEYLKSSRTGDEANNLNMLPVKSE